MFPLPRSGPSRFGLVAATVWLGLAAAAAAAERQTPGTMTAAGANPSAAASPPAATDPSSAGAATLIPANGRPIRLEVGKGTLIRLPRPASTVFVASPDVADVQVKSPTLVYVSAKAPGETVIYAVDANDQVLLNAPVRVDLDLSPLRQSLRQLVPGAPISVTQVDSSLVLSGAVASAGQAEKAQHARRRDRWRGQGRPDHQPPHRRHPGPGQSAGADCRGRPQHLEADRHRLEQGRLQPRYRHQRFRADSVVPNHQ